MNINSLWATLLIEECIRNGCDYFCVSPGSRSAPLTVAVARNPRAKKIICYDERGAAFHALGYARATGKAAVLICSSGTASANYLPAVIEADADGVPMLILAADRPPELRETMANQTIVQPNMFGRYVRWFFDLPTPSEAISPHMPLTTIDQAIYRAHTPAGPVHINCMFREPLTPVEGEISAEYLKKFHAYTEQSHPFTCYATPTQTLPQLNWLQTLQQAKRGLIVVGQLKTSAERDAVIRVATKLGWPILPDVTSGLRLGNLSDTIIHYFDQLLLKPDPALYPDTVLHLGGQFVSKRLLQFLQHAQPKNYILVNNRPNRFDPNHQVTQRIEATLQGALGEIINSLLTIQQPLDPTWVAAWQLRNEAVATVIEKYMALASGDVPIVHEAIIARTISQEIPVEHALFVGNSMPIRDVDMFASANGAAIPVAANRGASGIDGNVATALGYAVGLNRPTTLLLGDLTLLHDLNSLSLLRYVKQPLTLIVINNGGGGIFHLLPIRQFEDVFEENFGTPHSFEFTHAAQMFGINYVQPRSVAAFTQSYRTALTGSTHTLIEIRSDRTASWQAHQQLQKLIQRELEREQETEYILQNTALMQQIATSMGTHAAGTGYRPSTKELDEINQHTD